MARAHLLLWALSSAWLFWCHVDTAAGADPSLPSHPGLGDMDDETGWSPDVAARRARLEAMLASMREELDTVETDEEMAIFAQRFMELEQEMEALGVEIWRDSIPDEVFAGGVNTLRAAEDSIAEIDGFLDGMPALLEYLPGALMAGVAAAAIYIIVNRFV